MINENTKQLFVGNGAALDANNTSAGALTKQLAIVGTDMTCLNPAGGDTITTQPSIYIVNKYSDGTYKYSNPIVGTNVISWKGERYAPATRCVWTIGYNRKTATGLIEVNTDTDYEFSIKFKNDKLFFSERGEYLRGTFHSSTAATELSIATQICNFINNSSFGSQPSGIKVVKAILVGNGTAGTVTAASGSTPAIFDSTNATHYGVEITGLDINQFQDTSYSNKSVYFEVGVNDSIGFGSTTTCTQIVAMDYGIGTYNQIYNSERETSFNEGRLNARSFPIPSYTFLSTSTPVTSGSVAAAATSATGNISTGLIATDSITVTSTAGLRDGELITINAVAYEIKYIKSSTVAVLTTPLAATYTGSALKVQYLYNVFNIVVKDTVTTPGANIGAFAKKVIMIASPSIDDAAADPFDRTLDSADTSAESLDILDILNGWMTTTPLAPAALTLA